jgi:hypothetical protein
MIDGIGRVRFAVTILIGKTLEALFSGTDTLNFVA